MAAIAELQPASGSALELVAAEAITSDHEFDLVVACCAELSSSGRQARVREICQRNLNLSRLFAIAEHHRVIPRAFDQLTPFLSHQELPALASVYQQNARKAFLLTGELVKVLRHLNLHEIEALAHKGPALAMLLYGHVSDRQFCDLDVLVRLADVCRAKVALRELGYFPTVDLTAREERAYIASGYEYGFRSADGRILIELQWRILPRFYAVDIDVSNFFHRAVSLDLGGQSVRTLCNEDLLLALCLHAGKHLWAQLSLLCDIVQLAKLPVNWEAVEKRSKRLGIERLVAFSFLLAHKLLLAPLPDAAQAVVEHHPALNIFAEEISALIRRCEEYDAESPAYFRWMMRLRERKQDRLRFLWRLLTTPSIGEWSAVKLPDAAFPLYHFVRAARLGKRFAAAL